MSDTPDTPATPATTPEGPNVAKKPDGQASGKGPRPERRGPPGQDGGAKAQADGPREGGARGAGGRKKGGGKEAEEPAIEVVARGKGRREGGDIITVETATYENVTVNEDVDFAAMMKGDGGGGPVTPGFEPGTRVKAIVEVIAPKGPEIFLDLGGKATGYVLKEDVRDSDGNIVVKVGDEIEGIVYGQDESGIRIRVRLGQEADLRAVRAAQAAGIQVEGKVIGHNKGGYEVQVGNLRAFCPHSQIDLVRVENPESKLGQVLNFKITEIKDNGSVVVSHAAILKAEQGVKAAELMSKIAVGQRLKGRVRSIQKFGVFVDLGGKDGLVHVSELSWNRVEDPHQVVKLGDEVEVVVTEVNNETGKLGLSMKRAQEDPVEAIGAKLQVGEITTGTVTRLKDFGAFILLGDNVEGLVHISDLAHYRVKHPKDILKVGETVRVKVLEIDLDRRQIKLSLKALAADPWDGVAERYKVGQTVTGRVESVQDFGVFVALEPGVNALLPASESKTEGRPLAVEFKVGKDIEARILRVEPGDKKIALTRRDEEELRQRSQQQEQRGGPGGGGPRGPSRNTDRMNDLGIKPRGDADWTPPGGRRGGTLAYSDTPDKADKGKKGGMGSLGELLMKALKKDQ
ncbi:MAG: S1 RNA-binding domain-containing protein [Deltaproteobacteria bacterium]|nr:S1 RNA-binding domain-containing protein [Deltaproteobacteria bacterium]